MRTTRHEGLHLHFNLSAAVVFVEFLEVNMFAVNCKLDFRGRMNRSADGCQLQVPPAATGYIQAERRCKAPFRCQRSFADVCDDLLLSVNGDRDHTVDGSIDGVLAKAEHFECCPIQRSASWPYCHESRYLTVNMSNEELLSITEVRPDLHVSVGRRQDDSTWHSHYDSRARDHDCKARQGSECQSGGQEGFFSGCGMPIVLHERPTRGKLMLDPCHIVLTGRQGDSVI